MATNLTENEAAKLATDVYIFGYPLVTMETTRRVMTNVSAPGGAHAPMGQFANMREYPDASFRDVTAPNADTLYSVAFLDLAKEPYVLGLPDASGRYFLMPMLSGWTNVFAAPGTRTTGTKAQRHAVTGPNWKGALPSGVQEIKSPTNLVWIIGRTFCDGTPADYEAVHELQERYELTPLSAFGKPFSAPRAAVDSKVDMRTPVRDQVDRLEPGAYFSLLASRMKDNPPAAADGEMVTKMAKLGIEPGKAFDLNRADPVIARSLQRAPKAALERMSAKQKSAGDHVNGWIVETRNIGTYGTDYVNRAFITRVGLGANLPEDAVYPMGPVDANGKPFDGAKRYAMHFEKGDTPPVDGFWSLTMYDEKLFFVANPLDRYSISPRNGLKTNPDGSLDLFLQSDSPGAARESNWLPAPRGRFVVVLRMYWPKKAVLTGAWIPPAVQEAEGERTHAGANP